MAVVNSPPLTRTKREQVFLIATSGFGKRYQAQIQAGMTNVELGDALKEVLGIFGGSGGPGRLSVTHMGSGLRIWGGHHPVNHVQQKPLFSGKHTIAMAREVYGIADPDCDQPALL